MAEKVCKNCKYYVFPTNCEPPVMRSYSPLFYCSLRRFLSERGAAGFLTCAAFEEKEEKPEPPNVLQRYYRVTCPHCNTVGELGSCQFLPPEPKTTVCPKCGWRVGLVTEMFEATNLKLIFEL